MSLCKNCNTRPCYVDHSGDVYPFCGRICALNYTNKSNNYDPVVSKIDVITFYLRNESYGELSNWHYSPFNFLASNGKKYDVNCGETAFIIEKLIFAYSRSRSIMSKSRLEGVNVGQLSNELEKVLRLDQKIEPFDNYEPYIHEIKKIGRNIPFSQSGLAEWNAKMSPEFWVNILRWKFANKQFLNILLSTGNSILVEASPNDAIHGAGTNDINLIRTCLLSQGINKLPGTNYLGKALMKIREELS